MSPQFAYPNTESDLNNCTFIGCGRFIVSKKKPEKPYDYPGLKSMPSLSHVLQAANHFAPEPLDAKANVHEKKDRPDKNYNGDSMSLAYMLALTSRFRKLRLADVGDIWCTGVIKSHAKGPVLDTVSYGQSIEVKLQAFLEEDKDKVFLCPEAHLEGEAPNKLEKIWASVGRPGAMRIVSLNEFKGFISSDSFPEKTIVKVGRGKLKELVDMLFEKLDKKDPWKYGVFGLALICIILAFVVVYQQVSQDITLDWPLHRISRNEEYIGGAIRGFSTEELNRYKMEVYVSSLSSPKTYWLVDRRQLDGDIKGDVWYQMCRFGDEIPREGGMAFIAIAVLAPRNMALPGEKSSDPLEVDGGHEGFRNAVSRLVRNRETRAECFFSKPLYISRLGPKKRPCRITRIEDAKGKVITPTIPPKFFYSVVPPVKLAWTDPEAPMFVEVYNEGVLRFSGELGQNEPVDMPSCALNSEAADPYCQLKLKNGSEADVSTDVWLKCEL